MNYMVRSNAPRLDGIQRYRPESHHEQGPMLLPKNLPEEYAAVTNQLAVTFLDFSETYLHQLKQYIVWPIFLPKC